MVAHGACVRETWEGERVAGVPGLFISEPPVEE
jgi:hypothetical protein